MQFSPTSCLFIPLRSTFSSTPCSQTQSLYVLYQELKLNPFWSAHIRLFCNQQYRCQACFAISSACWKGGNKSLNISEPGEEGGHWTCHLGVKRYEGLPDRLWGPHSLLFDGYQGVKRPELETDHSHATNAEVKEMWIYTPSPPISLHDVVLN
jgi:hypothetical protein